MEVAARVPLDPESGIAIAIDDSSQIGEARRAAAAVAASVGLGETDAGKFAILVTEAATNIVKHAGRGELMLRATSHGPVPAAEVIAIDAGPGISDLQRAMADGYSTAGSPGNGMGAMSRLATSFDIFTAAGTGSVLAARVESGRLRDKGSFRGFDIGVVRVPKRGEHDCGDDWTVSVQDSGRAIVVLADGLGHGRSAAEASRRAIDVAVEHAARQPGMVVAEMHAALRSTRGAAVAVAELSSTGSTVRYAGLGNISAVLASARESRSLVSHNGIAGHEMRKIQEFSYEWPEAGLLVMHSDGLSARWDLSRYPGLAARDPSVVAGVLYRDYSRGRDDALVIVVRMAA
jgi:anti-sigma regulatory factor (Ser/Thr protein kinase)